MPILTTRIESIRLEAGRVLDRIVTRCDVRARHRRGVFSKLRSRFYGELLERVAADCGAELEPLGDGYARLHRDGRTLLVDGGNTMLDSRLAFQFTANKPLVLRVAKELGIPTPRSLVFCRKELDRAAAFLASLRGPAVVKPALGTEAGQGVTTFVRAPDDLFRATRRALAYGPRLLAEEQCNGSSFRLLYLQGELIDAVRRDPPSVIGDGRSTLGELIARENTERLGGDPITALHPITIDTDCRNTLREANVGMRSRPRDGQVLAVKTAANQNGARDNHRVLADVHPETVRMGREIAEAVGLNLAGVDVLTDDISADLGIRGGVIHEVNAGPGLHHHELVADPTRANVLARVLEHAFAYGPLVSKPAGNRRS